MKEVIVKKFPILFLATLLLLIGRFAYAEREVQLRLAPQIGGLTKLNSFVTDYGVKSFIFIHPELSINVQIYNRWFATASFNYAKLRTKIPGTSIDIFSGTAGIKLVAWETDQSSKDIIDGSRWWIGLELGDYITSKSDDPIHPSSKKNSFGLNVSMGCDYFINNRIGIGAQVKMHYVNYSLDDYILFSFGPSFIVKF